METGAQEGAEVLQQRKGLGRREECLEKVQGRHRCKKMTQGHGGREDGRGEQQGSQALPASVSSN